MFWTFIAWYTVMLVTLSCDKMYPQKTQNPSNHGLPLRTEPQPRCTRWCRQISALQPWAYKTKTAAPMGTTTCLCSRQPSSLSSRAFYRQQARSLLRLNVSFRWSSYFPFCCEIPALLINASCPYHPATSLAISPAV